MKYQVTTSSLIGAGDISHEDEWVFNTREEAQQFLDKFHEAFPKKERCMDYPYIPADRINELNILNEPIPEIKEIDDTRVDPYAWLDKQIKMKEEHIKKYGR